MSDGTGTGTSGDFSRVSAVILALAVGDSLGSTSEFQIPWNVGTLMEQYPGWPLKQVGGGSAHWGVGDPTDDTTMAVAILESVAKKGKFDPDDVVTAWIAWKITGPRDIGTTTSISLQQKISNPSAEFYLGGQRYYLKNKNAAANGSLMRNGVIPALFYKEDVVTLIDITVTQGIITHFHPLAVLTCVLHSLLIASALRAPPGSLKAPTLIELANFVSGDWSKWKKETKNPACLSWLKVVEKRLPKFEEQIINELKDFEKNDPYHQDYRGRSGYCILTLLISLWALHWSFQATHPDKLPEWLPGWIFEKHGFETITWVVTIGADADTYAATAGPLLAAYHPKIPQSMLDNLKAAPVIDSSLKNIIKSGKL